MQADRKRRRSLPSGVRPYRPLFALAVDKALLSQAGMAIYRSVKARRVDRVGESVERERNRSGSRVGAGRLLHPVRAFPLDLVHEVKVPLVEVVNADVAVFSAACVALAGGVGGDGVERAEVATDTADLVLENLVVESGLELAWRAAVVVTSMAAWPPPRMTKSFLGVMVALLRGVSAG